MTSRGKGIFELGDFTQLLFDLETKSGRISYRDLNHDFKIDVILLIFLLNRYHLDIKSDFMI